MAGEGRDHVGHLMNWHAWLQGLMAAFLSGFADGFLLNFVDPQTFNLTTGLRPLLTICTMFGAKAGFMWMKTHDFPTTVTVTEVKRTERGDVTETATKTTKIVEDGAAKES